MATRVDVTPGVSTSGDQTIVERYRRRYPRKEGQSNYTGLVRDNALFDVESRSRSLANILYKLDEGYTDLDWSVTQNLVEDGIEKGELSSLSNLASNTTPRLTISDRLKAINSFSGEDYFAGNHSGPSARFYNSDRPEYSTSNLPLWFTQLPSSSSISSAGGADDNNPTTSQKVFKGDTEYVIPSYWNSKASIPERLSTTELSLLPDTSITEDSNMRWASNPPPLSGVQNKWGIRWDGYLYLGPGTYSFEVQTNSVVRVDLAVGPSPYWVNVLHTQNNFSKTGTDKYLSSTTFNTSQLSDNFKRFENGSWVAYVPITIRLFKGAIEPNLFIKLLTFNASKAFYFGDFSATFAGTDGNWTITCPQLIPFLQDANASVSYKLVFKGSDVINPAVTLALSTNGTTITSTTTISNTAGTYTIRVEPVISGVTSTTPLWKTLIAGPSPNQKTYQDLISFSPDVKKAAFVNKPKWWKVRDGQSWNPNSALSSTNTPLDGLATNAFNTTLQSVAPGLGLYGNGSGVYSTRPSLILGEIRYSLSDSKRSNYIGINLSSDSSGVGGKLLLSGFPVNNSTFSATNILSSNDLGGGSNHLTAFQANVVSQSARLYLISGKYYLQSTVSANDDPTLIGLPAFSSSAWNLPQYVTATQVADDSAFTSNPQPFVAPLTFSIRKAVVSGFNVVEFSTTLSSILIGGSEVSSFSGKYVRFYTDSNTAFQFTSVDTGESLSFSDVLKVTVSGGQIIPDQSEIPLPASRRVLPFGFDESGLCYPPYTVVDPDFSSIAISDNDLYSGKPANNYDVFWGDHTKSDLSGASLTITEKLEFRATGCIEPLAQPVNVQDADFTHRIRFDIPINPADYDEDVLDYIASTEKVVDSYYGFVKLDS
jgi:hypothetical protein